jgi:hypothetical protein
MQTTKGPPDPLSRQGLLGAGDGGVLIVVPIERNVSYRQLRASEISERWRHNLATRRADRRAPAQTTLDLSLRAYSAVHAMRRTARLLAAM